MNDESQGNSTYSARGTLKKKRQKTMVNFMERLQMKRKMNESNTNWNSLLTGLNRAKSRGDHTRGSVRWSCHPARNPIEISMLTNFG